MNVFETLKNIFSELLLGQRAGPDAGAPDSEPERDGSSSGRWETRCVNPDIGCRFEVS